MLLILLIDKINICLIIIVEEVFMKRFLLLAMVALLVNVQNSIASEQVVLGNFEKQPQEVVVGAGDAGEVSKYEAGHKLTISGSFNFHRCVNVGTPEEKCDKGGGDGSVTIVGEFAGKNNVLAQLMALLAKLQQPAVGHEGVLAQTEALLAKHKEIGKPSEQPVERLS